MTNFDQSKHPRTAAGTSKGGQFALKAHSAPEVELGVQNVERELHAIEFAETIGWSSLELPSPRHRKPVPVEHTERVSMSVRTVSADKAPVEIEIPHGDGLGGDEALLVREYDGAFYLPEQPVIWDEESRTRVLRTPQHLREHGLALGSHSGFQSRDDALLAAQAEADSMLVIEGAVWRQVGEPFYRVTTLGLGAGDGTSLSVAFGPERNREDGPNSENEFAITDHESAVAYAVQVAESRRDHLHASLIRQQVAPKLGTSKRIGASFKPPARVEYRTVSEVQYSPDVYHSNPAERATYLQSELNQMTSALSKALPGAFSRTDAGSVSIDYSKLTSKQASDLREYLTTLVQLGRIPEIPA